MKIRDHYYLSVHSSGTVKVIFQMSIDRLKWETGVSPPWTPVRHTLKQVSEQMNIHGASLALPIKAKRGSRLP